MTEAAKIPEEQGQEAVRVAAAYQMQIAQEQATARMAALAPLRALVDTDGFNELVSGIADIVRAGTFIDDQSINPHLQAAHQILPNLKQSVV